MAIKRLKINYRTQK